MLRMGLEIGLEMGANQGAENKMGDGDGSTDRWG